MSVSQTTPVNRALVTVNIDELKALEQFDTHVPWTNWKRADFYGTVKINGTEHSFGTFQDTDVVQGLQFTQFVDITQRFVTIRVDAFDEDGIFDDVVDLSSPNALEGLVLGYDVLKGTVKDKFSLGPSYAEGSSVYLEGSGRGALGEDHLRGGITFRVNYDSFI